MKDEKITQKTSRSQNGAILPMVIILMLALTLTGIAFLNAGILENGLVRRQIHKEQSFYLAEAGVETAIWQFNHGDRPWRPWPAPWTDDGNGNPTRTETLYGSQDSSVGDYEVTVIDKDSSYPQIDSFGYAPSKEAEGKVQKRVRITLEKSHDPLFNYAIASAGGIIIENAGTVINGNCYTIVVMPNAIDIESFRDTPEPGQFKSKYQISGKYMVLFLGRVHKQKGIDFLIRAFSRLAKEIDDAVLAIVGPDDGYEKEARILANTLNLSSKVIFPGWVDGEDKLSAYTDADVLVYPSIFENYGLVPLEAIMCGTPVIVADDCGCGELIKKMGAGYLVKYGDLESLKKIMIRTLRNSDETARMVERGRRYIQENLVWDKVAVKVEQLYEKMS